MQSDLKKLIQSVSKRDACIACFGVVCGTVLGISLFSFFVPDAAKWTKLYAEERRVVEKVKRGEIKVPGDMWLNHAESLSAKSDNEYISDMINLNNTVVLLNNRLQFGFYPSSDELKNFGNATANERSKENEFLKGVKTKSQ